MAHVNFNGQDIFISTEETKEQYLAKAESLAKNYETLKEFYSKVFRPTLEEFNGKPLNNRFIMALQVKALDIDENIIIENLNRYNDDKSYLWVSTAYAGNGTAGRLQLSIVEKFYGSDQRLINAAATLHEHKPWRSEHKNKEEELQAMADGCRDTIAHYDDYMQQVADLKERIEKYNQVAWPFHSHISQHVLTTY